MKKKHNHKVIKFIYSVCIITTVYFLGFSMGFVLNQKTQVEHMEPRIVFQYEKGFRDVISPEVILNAGRMVASKSGKKYYSEYCDSVSNIKKENIIYFNTEEDAQSAGYEKTASCLF
ncbi:MAG: DNA/RNA endonuclease YhcR with UshA esterase domain [Flavobacteriaceae bacterium]|jgi:DNA/RNA endonuclease YhcR with UshA esterase domain